MRSTRKLAKREADTSSVHDAEAATASGSPPSTSLRPQSTPPLALRIPELLINIFTHLKLSLDVEESSASLAAVALVCTDWHPPATSLLYADLAIKWHYSRVQSLLWNLNQCPSLLNVTTSFTVSSFQLKFASVYAHVKDEYYASKDFEALLVDLGFEKRDIKKYGSELIKKGSTEDDLVKEILLEKMDELPDSPWMYSYERVEGKFGGPSGQKRLEQASEALALTIGKLTNLQRLSLRHTGALRLGGSAEREVDETGKVLDRIKSLDLWRVSDSLFYDVLRQTSNLTTLSLSQISFEYHDHLRAPPLPHLCHLSLTTGGRYVFASSQACDNILRLLIPYGATLQTLCLTFDFEEIFRYYNGAAFAFFPANFLAEIESLPLLSHFSIRINSSSLGQLRIETFGPIFDIAPNIRHFFLSSPTPFKLLESLPDRITHICVSTSSSPDLSTIGKTVAHISSLQHLDIFDQTEDAGQEGWSKEQEDQRFSLKQRAGECGFSLAQVIQSWRFAQG